MSSQSLFDEYTVTLSRKKCGEKLTAGEHMVLFFIPMIIDKYFKNVFDRVESIEEFIPKPLTFAFPETEWMRYDI